MKKLSILGDSFFNQNATTFNNLVSFGTLKLTHNKSLSDAIVKHCTNDYKSWDTALKDYTRNFIVPYLLKFNHIPQMKQSSSADYSDSQVFSTTDITSIDLKPKTLQNYRKNFFFINA